LEDFLAAFVTGVARLLRPLVMIAAISGVAAHAAQGASSTAEGIYASAPPRLLQIRTLVADAGRQISIGSGFLVSPDGLAITNYHVVSQAALEPKTYRLEYVAADGSHGDVSLLGVDLPNDLAIIRLDKQAAPFFGFDNTAVAGGLPKGERLYSMGNPLDLGFTIIEGTYNGLVEHSYNDRIHFSGALNPGMSGGPTVNGEGLVVGINVATRRGGQLVSFLVPARFAAALLQRVREQGRRATCAPRLRSSSPCGDRRSICHSAKPDFVRPCSGRTARPRRWRRGSIAGRLPMPVPRQNRAPISIRPIAAATPACMWRRISTPASSRSTIPTSRPSISISSSSPPS
jgi:S1-C subfamily serine protease